MMRFVVGLWVINIPFGCGVLQMLQLKKMIGKKVDILGVKVDKVNFLEAVKRVVGMVEKSGKHYVVTPNPEFVVLAQKDKQFREILNRADLAVADGVGLLAAAKFLEKDCQFKNRIARAGYLFFFGLKVGWWVLADKKKLNVLSERISGIDLVWRIAELCSQRGLSIALLGGREGVAVRADECLRRKYPNLLVVASWDGARADRILAGYLPKIFSDFLFVAFGHPRQEKWIAKNLKKLDVKVVIGVGGTFDFLTGKPKRCPLIFQKVGIEWLWRLVQEPKRWRRILTAFPYFPLLVLWRKIRTEV